MSDIISSKTKIITGWYAIGATAMITVSSMSLGDKSPAQFEESRINPTLMQQQIESAGLPSPEQGFQPRD